MCQANGKRLDVFMKTQKTKDYIECLENSHQTVVVYSEEGRNVGKDVNIAYILLIACFTAYPTHWCGGDTRQRLKAKSLKPFTSKALMYGKN